jgi:transcription initiation factor TFIID subunit 6
MFFDDAYLLYKGVLQEASRFMRHARRTTMTTSDIDQALRVLNIEPLYGHSPHNPPTFRRALPFPQLPTAGPVYFVEDEEIDFDRVLREEKITLPKGVSWTAHWLAVEGVQPLIPENPPAIPRDSDQDISKSPPRTNTAFPPTPPSPNRPTTKKQQQQQQLVKQVLSRELQLYYTRLTSSLLPPSSSDHAKRTAALASLRNDAGLQALLPYLIRWIGEGVVSALKEGAQSENDGKVLEVLLDVISAIMDNNTLFVEPYVSGTSSFHGFTSLKIWPISCAKSSRQYCLPCSIPLFLRPMRLISAPQHLKRYLAYSLNTRPHIPHSHHG